MTGEPYVSNDGMVRCLECGWMSPTIHDWLVHRRLEHDKSPRQPGEGIPYTPPPRPSFLKSVWDWLGLV